jgi:hypothetical protein
MNNREIKRWRKQYRKKINDMTNLALKKEIFRLARNRDTLGIVVIALAIALIISIFLNLR